MVELNWSVDDDGSVSDDGGSSDSGGGGSNLDAFSNIDTGDDDGGSSDDNNLSDSTADAFSGTDTGDDGSRSTSSDSGIGSALDDVASSLIDAPDTAQEAAEEEVDDKAGGLVDGVEGAFDSLAGGSGGSSDSGSNLREQKAADAAEVAEGTTSDADQRRSTDLEDATDGPSASDSGAEKSAGEKVKDQIGAFVQGAKEGSEEAAEETTGAFDFAAGSTDEAVARTFDGTEGGGLLDGVADATGVTATQQDSEAFNRIQEDYAATEGDSSLSADVTRANLAVSAGTDFVFDNPNASVQEGVKEAAKAPTEFATGEEISDEELAGSAVDVATKFREMTAGATEGTAADNWAVDGAFWAADAVVADPLKTIGETVSGVDVDAEDGGEGEARVNAAELGTTAFDAALFGAGSAGAAGARAAVAGGSDEGGSLLARALGRGGDDAASGADDVAGGADDATGASDEAVAEAVRGVEGSSGSANISTDLFGRVQIDGATAGGGLADEVGGLVDDVTSRLPGFGDEAGSASSGADDVTGGADDLADDVTGGADEVTPRSVPDDATSAVTRLGDDAASGADDATGGLADRITDFRRRLVGGSDEAAQVGDDAASAGDDAASGADDATGAGDDVADETGGDGGGGLFDLGTGTKIGLAGGSALAGGVTLLEYLRNQGEFQLTDPQTGETFTLTKTKEYPPTERFDSGGTLWRVSVNKSGSVQNKGLTIIVGVQGRNVVILDRDGNRTKAQVPVETFKKAIQAGKQGGNGGASA